MAPIIISTIDHGKLNIRLVLQRNHSAKKRNNKGPSILQGQFIFMSFGRARYAYGSGEYMQSSDNGQNIREIASQDHFHQSLS